jgi:hypothetical protein
MKGIIAIALIILSGIILYSCATTCPIIIPPASTAQGQSNK